MNSTKGGAKPFIVGTTCSLKEKSISEISSGSVDQLNQGMADVSIDSAEDGEWEVYTKKSKSRAGSSASKQCGSQNPNPKAMGNANGVQKLGMQSNIGSRKGSGSSVPIVTADSKREAGRGSSRRQSSNRGIESNYASQVPVMTPALQRGCAWKSTGTGSTLPLESDMGKNKIILNSFNETKVNEIEDGDDDSDNVDDTDDELLSDDWDSDESQKSHDTRKKSKRFKTFFEILDKLTDEQINEPAREWLCPACKDGRGGIDKYRGLQPLLTHAKTKISNRVKHHRELAELLDEELRQRGTSVISAGEVYGKWKGLDETVKDHDIVWPPMVVIRNTRLEKDDNDKWLGIGNQELLDFFRSYNADKAKHSYGRQGHRDMSVLIFESSPTGYLEAERLDKHFKDQGIGREAWDRCPFPFHPGGQRQLYGYMAEKGDKDFFEQCFPGKSKLKFELRSYQEVVVSQVKQMSEDNQQLVWWKDEVAKAQRLAKAIEESYVLMTEKLRKTSEENLILKQRTKKHHEEHKEEMDNLEQFFKDQLRNIQDAKEDNFEKMQQEEREKVNHT